MLLISAYVQTVIRHLHYSEHVKKHSVIHKLEKDILVPLHNHCNTCYNNVKIDEKQEYN
jgi:hypothetical protein